MYFLVQVINGLQIGSVYALIALGYTMVYGIIKLINFAHGDLMMVASYFIFFGISYFRWPFWLAVLAGIGLTALVGVLIEKIAYRPLRHASRLSALITAIAISLVLQNIFMITCTPDPRRFPMPDLGLPSFKIGSVVINGMTPVSIIFAILVMILLQWFVTKTKTGKAMLATSEDMKAAQMMGINVNRTISITFLIGSALAGLASAIYLMAYPIITPYMGSMPGLKAFIAAVIGGIGLIPGAMVGGFVLGLLESLARGYIPSQWSSMTDALVFAVLIVVLLVRPAGILGKVRREKV